MNIGFKIDNCDSNENIEYFYQLLSLLKKDQPFEIGLECYNPRGFNKESILSKRIAEELKEHTNKIVHLTLTAKLLNISALNEEDWLQIWKEQKELVELINPNYLVLHATSKESKIFSEKKQIENICSNYLKVYDIFKRPIFVENTYEDLSFYELLFESASPDLNFVFDIGHMKVHSKKSQNEWISFLKKLEKEGRLLHFHIHDNNGIYDLHRNISEDKNEEVISFIKLLLKEFSVYNFILETHKPNLENIKKDLEILRGE